MKITAALTAGAAALAVALAGCSGGSSGASPGGHVDLTVWTGFTGGDRPGYAQIVKDFNASQDKVTVKMVVQPWDTIGQKLPSAWLTGSGPDLAAPSSDPNVIAQYVKTKSVLPITSTGSGAGKVDVDQLNPSLVEEFTYDGKLYAVPANFATLSLYYNKDAFAAAGISSPPQTVADFRADAQKLTSPDGGQYGLALADHETIQMWPILQWLEGGDIVDSKNCSALSSSRGQASLKPWTDLVAKDKISPVGLSGAEADSLFSAGKAAMEMNGPWAAAGYEKAGVNFGIATIPVGADGKPATLSATAALAVSAKSEHPKEAQQFLAYWTSKEAQKKFSLSTGFPSIRTDLVDDPQLTANQTIATFASQADGARLYLPHVPQATKVDSDAYVPLIGKLTRGGDVATETAAATKTIDALTGCSS